MSNNIFFKSKGPFKLNSPFPKISNSKINIKDIKTLYKCDETKIDTKWI